MWLRLENQKVSPVKFTGLRWRVPRATEDRSFASFIGDILLTGVRSRSFETELQIYVCFTGETFSEPSQLSFICETCLPLPSRSHGREYADRNSTGETSETPAASLTYIYI